MNDKEFTNPLREGMRLTRLPQPNTLVIFGATGDLTKRKLIPSLLSLFNQDLLPPNFTIVAFARRDKTSNVFRQEMKEALEQFAPQDVKECRDFNFFLNSIIYHMGDFNQPEPHVELKSVLEKIESEKSLPANRLFYLATPPSAYENIINNLGQAGLQDSQNGWTRIIIEKPFGNDVDSAHELNEIVRHVFDEDQIYRIDHYLGKETVQNILVFRFANGIFEPVWNRRYIDHVQITVAETLGVEGRGKFYEETGITRDIVQNHMLQLMCLFAMEPPSAFDATAIRDEKVKVLKAIKPLSSEQIDNNVIRGQYGAGSLNGKNEIGYLQEDGVSPESFTETYVAMKLKLDNWRWAGVPFFLRAGKRLPKRVTEISIAFKQAPMQLFGADNREQSTQNMLVLQIQPDEGITLRFDSKVPGPAGKIRPVTMDFRYGTSFGEEPPDAYERLLLDAMLGDSTLFTRADENEMAWKIITPILERWQEQKIKLPQYEIGSWGPQESDELIGTPKRNWRRL